MSIGILGNKIGMTQIFDKSGDIIPVTIIKVGPCIITQIKTVKTDGYNAIQIGYGNINNLKITKPKLGHFKKFNIQALKYLQEYKVTNPENFSVGQIINTEIFDSIKVINISGKTCGKGFSGSHKRHNFARGPMSHGSKNHRAPGSIGQGTSPGRVFPGKKMPGQLGNKMTTVKNLEVIEINPIDNLLIIKGSIPGKPGNLVNITILN